MTNPDPDLVLKRFMENITLSVSTVRSWHRVMLPSELTVSKQRPPPGSLIPQRPYCQGAVIQGGAAGQIIMFATADGGCFPAESALAGQCGLLVDANGTVFPDHNQTINMRVEVCGCSFNPMLSLIPLLHLQWPGYDGWGAQVNIVVPK